MQKRSTMASSFLNMLKNVRKSLDNFYQGRAGEPGLEREEANTMASQLQTPGLFSLEDLLRFDGDASSLNIQDHISWPRGMTIDNPMPLSISSSKDFLYSI